MPDHFGGSMVVYLTPAPSPKVDTVLIPVHEYIEDDSGHDGAFDIDNAEDSMDEFELSNNNDMIGNEMEDKLLVEKCMEKCVEDSYEEDTKSCKGCKHLGTRCTIFGILTSCLLLGSIPAVFLVIHYFRALPLPPLPVAHIIVVGDISFDGPIRHHVDHGNCTYNRSFEKIRPIFDSADSVIANVESPVISSKVYENYTSPNRKFIKLLGKVEALESLRYAGVDIATLANNHFMDHGEEVINTTIKGLKKLNVSITGVTQNIHKPQKPVIFKSQNITFGVLSYCDNLKGCIMNRNRSNVGVAVYDTNQVINDVDALKQKQVDIVIVYVHWGRDRVTNGLPYMSLTANKTIMGYINRLKGSGIDLLVGSHPHDVHKHGYFGNMLVVLSLGNFLFPKSHSKANRFYQSHGTTKANETNALEWAKIQAADNPGDIFDMTKHGKMISIGFNKNGIVNKESKYMDVEINADENRCLQPIPNGKWTVICEENDRQCLSK